MSYRSEKIEEVNNLRAITVLRAFMLDYRCDFSFLLLLLTKSLSV